MGDTHRSHLNLEPEGRTDAEGDLYLPSENEEGPSAGGGLGDGTTSGTTGRILEPGAGNPVDDKEF